jgi:uncharacterized membrane protein YkvA (DUF1232 family)
MLKQIVRDLRTHTTALYFAARDPRTPWYAKALVLCVVGYALSPIDLIPDFIPLIGYLDDAVLIPLGVALAIRLVPPTVWADCRRKAQESTALTTRAGRVAAALVLALWTAALALLTLWLLRLFRVL